MPAGEPDIPSQPIAVTAHDGAAAAPAATHKLAFLPRLESVRGLAAVSIVWYHVVPELIPVLKGVPEVVLACMGLGLFTSARVAQQVKAGINTLPKGQRYAGLAMGMTLAQTYRFVLLPVALRIVLPTLTSESMNIIKNSSVASAIGVTEMIYFATQAGEETSMHGTMYLAVTILYFISAFTINRLAAVVDRRSRLPGFGGAK